MSITLCRAEVVSTLRWLNSRACVTDMTAVQDVSAWQQIGVAGTRHGASFNLTRSERGIECPWCVIACDMAATSPE